MERVNSPELQAELEKWKVAKIDPTHMTPEGGVFLAVIRIESMKRVFVEKGLVTEEELDAMFDSTAIEMLSTAREEILPALQAQRRNLIKQGIRPPV